LQLERASKPPLFTPAAFFVLFIVLAGVACSNKQVGSDVMATVNGRKITRTEVQKFYDNQIADAPQKPSAEQADTLRLNILSQLINNEILMQRAEKLGLLATDEEVNAKITEIKAPFTQQQFDQRLKERNITFDDFKRDLRRSLTIDKVLNKEVTSKIDITDDDITNYYNQHKAEFNLIEPQYHLAQILVTTQPNPQIRNMKAQNEAEARKKIQMVANRLDSGEDFATVAMSYSEQPDTAQNGGDLGFVPESAFAKASPELRRLVMSLKPGEISPILPAPDGFRIFKIISKEPSGQRELTDPRVQQTIRETLQNRKDQLLKAAFYEVARNDAKVVNYLARKIVEKSGEAAK